MKCYKILNNDMTSYGGCKWAIGEWNDADSLGPFCRPGGFHGYEHPLLAVLHNPLHANIREPRLFEAEADGEIAHDGKMLLKAKRMRIVLEIPVPAVSIAQRVAYGIYCAKAVYSNQEWTRWADAWLSGEDRSWMATVDAAELASREAEASWAEAAEWESADKTWAELKTVYAARAAKSALAADATARAAWAAESTEWLAVATETPDDWAWELTKESVAHAALAATRAGGVDLVSCAERAMGVV